MAQYKVEESSLTAVADAIREKSGASGALEFPNGFVSAVENITCGGFTPPEDEVLTPELVYQTTRPGDWLTMPTPGDDEIYLLGHVQPVVNGIFTATVGITGTCLVEIGTLQNGEFVPMKSITPQSTVRFTENILYSDFGHPTSKGAHQYLVKVKGQIDYLYLLKPNNYSTTNNIVDIVCGMDLDRIYCGETATPNTALHELRYLNFVGNGRSQMISPYYMYCKSLLSIRCDAPPTEKAGSSFVSQCTSLIAVSPNFLPTGKYSLSTAFYNTRLSNIQLNGYPTALNAAFAGTPISAFSANTEYVTTFAGAFTDCYCLKTVTGLNITSVTNFYEAFKNCVSLSRLVFAGETTPGGSGLDLRTTSLNHAALVEMFDSLPTATKATTITITGVPGAAELTDAEIAVATAKNWTITR